jgi:hypothetical protein
LDRCSTLNLYAPLDKGDNPLTCYPSPAFVFQTGFPPGGIPTNYASGDFVLFTGLQFGQFPSPGNPGPITITFDEPVSGAGSQLTVDDTFEFTAFISALDVNNNLLGTFSTRGTSSVALDNSAQFIGIQSDIANISSLIFSSSEPNRAIGLNALSIATTPASVPEPLTALGTAARKSISCSCKTSKGIR